MAAQAPVHGSQTRVMAIPQPQQPARQEAPGKLTLDQALGSNEGKVASALLGSPPPTPTAAPATATFRRTAVPGSLPTEKLVLWILIAAMPTFLGLLMASDMFGVQVHEVVRTIGASVRECSEGFFEWIKTR